MLKTCVHCGEEFNPKATYHRKGKINECGDCAEPDVKKYIGMMDAAAKSGSGLNIFRKEAEINTVGAVLKAQCRAGFNANLGLGNTASTFGQKSDI